MYCFFKTFFDYSFSIILLFLLSPIIFFCSLLIFFDLGPPIFFKQKRGGLNGEPFNIIKFRTMSNHGDLNPSKINDEKRTTKLGAILRKFSLDELPTLINIIKGEMSFVGPRPLLYEYKKHYNDDQNKRFLVKPGITGWAQVNGRNKLSWEEKFNLDNWYIKNQTLLLDFKIILMTVKKIFLNTDVDFDKSKDDIKFRGTNENNKS
jgi:sugar transferase EpsL